MQRELTWGKLWPHGARPSFRRQSQKTVSGMHGSGRASLSTDVCILLTDNKLSRRMEPWGQTLGCVTWGLESYLIEKWLQTPAESEVSHHCQMCQPNFTFQVPNLVLFSLGHSPKAGKGDGCSEGIQEGLTTPLWAEELVPFLESGGPTDRTYHNLPFHAGFFTVPQKLPHYTSCSPDFLPQRAA